MKLIIFIIFNAAYDLNNKWYMKLITYYFGSIVLRCKKNWYKNHANILCQTISNVIMILLEVKKHKLLLPLYYLIIIRVCTIYYYFSYYALEKKLFTFWFVEVKYCIVFYQKRWVPYIVIYYNNVMSRGLVLHIHSEL